MDKEKNHSDGLVRKTVKIAVFAEKVVATGVAFGILGTAKLGVLGYRTSSFIAENSWKYAVEPFMKKIAIPHTIKAAEVTGKGSRRFYKWSETQYKKPVSISLQWEGHKHNLKTKMGHLGVVGLIATGSIVNTFFPWVSDTAQAAGHVIQTGAQSLEDWNKNMSEVQKQTFERIAKEEKEKPAKAPKPETPTPAPVKTAEPTVTPTKVPVPQPTAKVDQKVESSKDQPLFVYEAPFAGEDANKAIKKLGGTAGSPFHLEDGLPDKLFGQVDPFLLPVAGPPSVMQYKDLIYAYSYFNPETKKVEFWAAPNPPAVIMTMESNGDKFAGSWAGAQGLMQVMPFNFPWQIQVSENSLAIMKDPQVNIKQGIQHYKGNLSDVTKKYSGQYVDTHSQLYARAAMVYNAGPVAISAKTTLLDQETQNYSNFFGAAEVDLAVASQLRGWGLTDREILLQMRSREVEARAFVLQKMMESRTNTYAERLRLMNAISIKNFTHPGATAAETQQMQNFYNYFKNHRELWLEEPVPPWMLVFKACGGGFMDIVLKDENNKPILNAQGKYIYVNRGAEKWLNVDTKKVN